MDWQNLISDLAQAGMTQAQIAQRVGVTQSLISELSTGKAAEPRYGLAMKLIRLHKSTKRRPSKQEAV